MTLHLIKLCVGVESAEDLANHLITREAQHKAAGIEYEPIHTTRMIPKRKDELLDGGSLYWVMKGRIQARQRLLDIRPFKDEEGISRCHLVLDRELIITDWQPRRAFQGWRYLKVEDAPKDNQSGNQADQLSPEMREELAELGLL